MQYLMLHPSLRNASQCLSILGTELTVLGLGLLFIFPPAGAACFAMAAVVGAAQLGVDLLRRERGDRVGGRTLGWDAVGAIPFGGSEARGLRIGGEVVGATEHLLPGGAHELSHLVPGGGLAAHEAAGGHTLEKACRPRPGLPAQPACQRPEPDCSYPPSTTARLPKRAIS